MINAGWYKGIKIDNIIIFTDNFLIFEIVFPLFLICSLLLLFNKMKIGHM